MGTLKSIEASNDKLKSIKLIINDYRNGKMDDEEVRQRLIPNIRFIDQVGATALFHSVLGCLGDRFDDCVEIQICKMLACYEAFDYVGMAYWLQQVRTQANLTLEQRAVVAINSIFANANGGCFDDYVVTAITELEDLLYNDNYLTFEGLENLMQELEENGDVERLVRYVVFLENYVCKIWKEYCWIIIVMFNHYRRENNFAKLNSLLLKFSNGLKQYDLTEVEKLQAEIQYLRLLFECRDGSWEKYSISLFMRHEVYLNADIEVAMSFVSQFFSIVQDGRNVYGRFLNDRCILDISKNINDSLKRFIQVNQTLIGSLQLELLNSRRFFIEVRKEIVRTDSILGDSTADKYVSEIKKIQTNMLNLCKVNGNKREYIHWLLCFTDELNALSCEIDISSELREKAEQLEELVKAADYSPSISYYLIFLAEIWDCLGEEGKAREILRKYNETGASIKVYNISTQKKYLRLEDKYRLLPQNRRRDLLDTIILLTDLNTSREIQEGLIRAESQFHSIDLTDDNYITEVGLGNILRFIIKCGHIFLNASRFDLMDLLWDKYEAIVSRWEFNPDVKSEVELNRAVSLFRRGLLDDAYRLADSIERQAAHDVLRLRALIMMGDVEAAKSWPEFRINSMSKALGLAESLGLPNEMALIYHKLGCFFCPYYPALGISFLRKAETIYGKLGMTDELYEMYLLRAQASMLIHIVSSERYIKEETDKNITLPFLEEARSLLKEYPRSVYKSESSRAFHDRISGMIECDIPKLNDAYLFYQRVGAYKDVLLVLESAIITCSVHGERLAALNFAQEFLNRAIERSDSIHIYHARDMIRILNMPGGVVLFPYVKRPYKETTLLDILDVISFEEERWALCKDHIRKHFPYPCDEGKCELFKEGDVVALHPVCLRPFTYYRGQSKRYYKKPEEKESECVPSLYRSNMSDSGRFLERLKYCELHLLLETYPLCAKFRNAFIFRYPDGKEEVFNFNVYHLAIAQHYGIATELIDVTSDKWIAAFFASTKYENEEYSPYREVGTGVFYTITEPTPEQPSIRPIGIQPFSRPGEQRGYAVPMGEKENFEDKASVIEFKHYPEINEFIFNYSNRSKKLFPRDVLLSKVNEIKSGGRFSKAAYDMAITKFYQGVDEKTIDEWMTQMRISICDEPVVRFTEEEIEEYRRDLPRLLNAIQENILVLNLGYRTYDGGNFLYSIR